MQSEPTNLWRIYSETMSRLDKFDRCVQEGKALEQALDFARWLFFSGIITLCEMNPQPFPLKVDGSMLRWKCEDLQRKVQERFRLNDTSPRVSKTEMDTLHDKLDKIAGFLSRFPQPAVAVNPSVPELDGGHAHNEMQLSVIPGGLAERESTEARETVCDSAEANSKVAEAAL